MNNFLDIISNIDVESIKAKCAAKAKIFDEGMTWDHVKGE
jgi:hypothetical protein